MDLLLTAGLPWPTILYTVLIDEIMIITGLIGALVTSSYKVVPMSKLSLNIADTPTVGLLHIRLPRSSLGCMDSHRDRTQARSRYRRRCA